MSTSSIKLQFALLAFVATLAFETTANAQTAVARKVEARLDAAVTKLEAACGNDLRKYCSQVAPGEGRLLYCIMAHEDKISTQCDYALFEASRKLERALNRIEEAADACWNDIQKHCANVPEGGGQIAQCLVNKKASLTKGCRTAIAKFPAAN